MKIVHSNANIDIKYFFVKLLLLDYFNELKIYKQSK